MEMPKKQIEKVSIRNFKSIKQCEFNAKRINLFIGKPNTGKSNLLEALGIFSLPFIYEIKSFFRVENLMNLFYDNQISEKIEVKVDEFIWVGSSKDDRVEISFFFPGFPASAREQPLIVEMGINGGIIRLSSPLPTKSPFKFYRFKSLTTFPRKEFDSLLPPSGENLLAILSSNNEIYQLISDLLEEYGLELVLEESESKIKIIKRSPSSKRAILHPFSLLSDTLQRVIFFLTAIESNKNSVLIFEEPEAHAFPYYTKILAEDIALDNNNQYFISTHNPYLLLSILEKAPKDDTAIFITYLDEYQTKLKELNEKEKEEILNQTKDIFFNIENFIEK